MILDDIIAKQKTRIENEKKEKDIETLKREVLPLPSSKNFFFENSLKNKDFAFICEIKKASPSKGVIVEDFTYTDIAQEYEKAGASAISVLTEPHFFKGNDKYLKDVADIVNIPVLRKDFIIDEYQIYQAKLIGADAVLLICAVLDESTLKNFIDIATSLKLSCLVETHNEEEIKKALNCNAKIIGINNRDLKTFNVDINTSLKLRKFLPNDKILISESGIKTAQDIKMLKDAGFNGALIGESMMRSKNKQKFLLSLKGEKVNG
ncbi:indole-3-glycerol phosphate synthase TrpC [Candidatus Ruminimicrobiellum ovillum]|uniref:indole-3-glycerol phosphate synthase TrpC n=1 Tax=Candidatus Ruminimicrobiellum ovillum TaxID=1947927 RepID=UPI00355A7933